MITGMRKFLAGSMLLGWVGLASACLPSAAPPTVHVPPPTPTTVTLYVSNTPTVAAQSTRTAPTLTASHLPQPGEPCEPAQSTSAQSAIRYTVDATLDYETRQVQVRDAIAFRNETGDTLDELVFYFAPNAQPGVVTLEAVTQPDSDAPLAASLEGTRLSVQLPEPLGEHCAQDLTIAYLLNVLPMGEGYFPLQGYLGFSERQFNLGHWLPTVAHRVAGEWITPPRINVGEQEVIPAADFEVALTARHAPRHLTVVGPGTVEQRRSVWRFSLSQARDLTLSLSNQYRRQSATAANGVEVELYTLDEFSPSSESAANAPDQALDTAVAALELYSDLYGPYPYDRLVVLESDFPDGMEFSGLVFVGGEWFRGYHGDPASYLTLITAHEVSHQWWYVQVANDQSQTPWLDEALATYSEYVFLQEIYPELTDWWWRFRVDAYAPEGFVDSTVYEFNSIRGYINAVYLQGARLVHRLREDVGGEAFFQWLHDYVEAERGQIATPESFWAALPPDLLEATQATREAFLRRSEIAPNRPD